CDRWSLTFRRLKDSRNERRFFQGELLVRLVEVQARRGFDPVCAVAEVHVIAVNGEDFPLRVPLFELDGENDLPNLALEQLLFGETKLVDIARHLLRQGAGALIAPPLDE